MSVTIIFQNSAYYTILLYKLGEQQGHYTSELPIKQWVVVNQMEIDVINITLVYM